MATERKKNGPKPRSRMVWYCSKVGLKVNGGISVGWRLKPGKGMNVGGRSTAAASLLRLVATRYSTGKNPMRASSQATMAKPMGACSVAGVALPRAAMARMAMVSVPLGQAGQHLEQVLDGDDGQDNDDDTQCGRLADVFLGECHLVDEERQVGAGGARTTLGGHVDTVELLDDVHRAEQRPQLDEAIEVGQDDIAELLDPSDAIHPRSFADL